MTKKQYYGLFTALGVSLSLSLLYCPPFDLGMSDKEIFTYTGWAISKGLVPYRDFFDHKPPLIFFIYFTGLRLGGPWGLWILNTLLALFTTAAFFDCCRRHRLAWPWLLPLALLALARLRRRAGRADERRAHAYRPRLARGGIPPLMRAPRLSGLD